MLSFIDYIDGEHRHSNDHKEITTVIEIESCPDQKRECTPKNRTIIEIVCNGGLKDECSYETKREKCQTDVAFCRGRLFHYIVL